MTCSMQGCDHKANVSMRIVAPMERPWRDYCGCCAELAMLLFYLAGKRVEFGRLQGDNVITDEEMEKAHAVLSKEDVRVSDLLNG